MRSLCTGFAHPKGTPMLKIDYRLVGSGWAGFNTLYPLKNGKLMVAEKGVYLEAARTKRKGLIDSGRPVYSAALPSASSCTNLTQALATQL